MVGLAAFIPNSLRRLQHRGLNQRALLVLTGTLHVRFI